MPPGEFETLGVVSGTAVMGANFLQDFAAGLTDFFGGRSGQYERTIGRGRVFAIGEMCDEAQKRGATAVVGVKVDQENMNNMLLVTATGTAVRKPS
jgi:uncharacterized protein YbjQ (UPF0145 family)